ncbi:YheC/YheD family protein [Tumebacillus permanentifrigoris]|uniref:YheC/D-like protein n=1 Tax=Tumebacillus permanentifrigoris TaxID=378543 RepID=A0A316E0Q8_9BACL|nr:YheC/YheD family protein [Tumebacillus permanentifrigoris]PWK16400.1 YheC/D-like protein [Tumebacillus permanentifrigoris]
MKKPTMPGSKWTKYKLLRSDPALADLQPETRLYTPSALRAMLRRYETLYVKPNDSFGGLDVLCLTRTPTGLLLQSGKRKKTLADIASFDRFLRSISRGRTFIIQRGIALRPWHGRPVDIRTLVQRHEKGLWETLGLYAKAAAPGLAITNLKSGGKILTVKTYLRALPLSLDERAAILRDLQLISEQVASALGERYRNRRYGLDIGLDEQGKLWLIEVNGRVSLNILRRVDNEMYRRAMKRRKQP